MISITEEKEVKESVTDAPSEFSGLNQTQKLSRFLLMLDPENAIQIMKHLAEDELESVASEMLKIGNISQEVQHEILREFFTVVIDAAASIGSGLQTVQPLLEKSVG